MVFGNNLIDFSANGVNVQVATQATNFIVPDLGTNPNPPTGGTPRRILPQTISKTYTGLTFTVELDGDSYIGCGPKDAEGNDYGFGGACVSYLVDMDKTASQTESEIKAKLLKFLKDLRDAEKAQQEYEEAQARWEQDKLGCESEIKDGSSFLFVNADRNYAPVGPPTENWICQETIYAIEPEETEESQDTENQEDTTETEEESTSSSVVVAQTTVRSTNPKSNIKIGFSEGFKSMAQRGILIGGVLLVGYGGLKFEERTNFFSKMFKGKKKTPKTNATPKTTEANA